MRSCARFFVHQGNEQLAHDIVRKSKLVKYDPWLLATEIAIASLRERNSVFTKSGLQILSSGNFHPFNTTELASSIGTVEANNNNIKKSKKLFDQSLISPNDNSLAQAEWVSQEMKILNPVNVAQFQIVNPFEAFAFDLAKQKKWQNSIDYSKKWFLDIPFSKRAVLFGNEIAGRRLKNFEKAIEIAKMGLLSHPNDIVLLNNIIYYLCMLDKTDEAKTYLSYVNKEEMSGTGTGAICLLATRGLYAFRCGFADVGRNLYKQALMLTREHNLNYLGALALINYVREEIRLGQIDISQALPNIYKIIESYDDSDAIVDEAKEVVDLYNNRRE